MATKDGQLQIRVSSAQKQEIRRRAETAGMPVSQWVLQTLLPGRQQEFLELCRQLTGAGSRSHVLAALNDFLHQLSPGDFPPALAEAPVGLPVFEHAYLCAMVEHAAAQRGAAVPHWVLRSEPLGEPYFASELKSLRLHLLTQSPPAFRRRNLFVDATVGARV